MQWNDIRAVILCEYITVSIKKYQNILDSYDNSLMKKAFTLVQQFSKIYDLYWLFTLT
jgi:hypothetical protein